MFEPDMFRPNMCTINAGAGNILSAVFPFKLSHFRLLHSILADFGCFLVEFSCL